MKLNMNLVVKVVGARGKANLILEGHGPSCGEVFNGIGARLDDERGSFVIDWESFEAAYLALKATRARAEAAYADLIANPDSWESQYRKYVADNKVRPSHTSAPDGIVHVTLTKETFIACQSARRDAILHGQDKL